MRKGLLTSFIIVPITLVCAVSAFAGEAKLSVDEILAKHQASIGTPEALAAAKVRLVQGEVAFGEIYSRMQKMTGPAMMVSGAGQQKTEFKFGSPQYPGETLILNEKGSTQIAEVNPGRRSMLGDFLFTEPAVLKEGLWGGTWSTSWPLLRTDAAKSMRYRGLKKVSNQRLHDVEYTPRKGRGDMSIHLYFEPETFRHVLTLYTVTVHSQNTEDVRDQGAEEMRTFLEERFSDFKTVEGLTLPSHWDIHWHKEPTTKPQEYRWDLFMRQIQHNPTALLGTGAAK